MFLSIFAWIWSWFTPFWIGLYLIIVGIPTYYTIFTYKPILKGTPELN